VPLDFAEDLAAQRGLAIDREGYERAMEGQRGRARAAGKFKVDAGKTIPDFDERFVGYETTSHASTVRYLVDESLNAVDRLEAGHSGGVVLDETPVLRRGRRSGVRPGRAEGAAWRSARH
jgi:alanyl-tRNA synthetase